MYPFLLMLTLTAGDLPAPAPGWNADYLLARQRAAQADKPLAVFIGLGEKGWQALGAEGRLSPEVCGLLAERYVCVYLDASRWAGYEWARAFDADQAPMLILSDHSGNYQVFRQVGAMSNASLLEALERYGPVGLFQPLAQATCPS
jgi:hypothetical protein